MEKKAKNNDRNTTKSIVKSSAKSVLFLLFFILFFWLFAGKMGFVNMINTMMNTAYRLLIDTCFYLMAIAVLIGAISSLLTEFGVVELLNRLLSPLMRPIFGMPGAAALGIISTYLSDNPAILTLADIPSYRACFKTYQIPAITNIGTGFGMGLIVTAFMLGLKMPKGSGNLGIAVLCGNLGAITGSVVSTRLMLVYTKKVLPDAYENEDQKAFVHVDDKLKQSVPLRVLNSLLDGGNSGLKLGLGIIPSVVVVCTIIMMLTNSASESGAYTGAAYEGIGILPLIGSKINFILKPLFGFTSTADISVPITALGSAGASLSLIPKLIETGAATCNDIAVFTAMCMCWSGYLGTHVSMMESLGYRKFTGRAILSHTVGGLIAGVSAHWLFMLLSLI